jgi:hypothetical protein
LVPCVQRCVGSTGHPTRRTPGEHHMWFGARQADGAGQLRVNGKLTTTRRVGWELERGPLPPGVRVRGRASRPTTFRARPCPASAPAAQRGARIPARGRTGSPASRPRVPLLGRSGRSRVRRSRQGPARRRARRSRSRPIMSCDGTLVPNPQPWTR